MDRIYREQAIEETKKLFEMGDCYCDRASMIGMLNSMPSAEKTGKWFDKGSLSCRCSECGCKSPREYAYCPNCGAKMEVEE